MMNLLLGLSFNLKGDLPEISNRVTRLLRLCAEFQYLGSGMKLDGTPS
ncbi:MAG: hypothetical protein HP494_05885 [Nitrospira sp.]|nr:hypothetical protein [Nitrospira sp.]